MWNEIISFPVGPALIAMASVAALLVAVRRFPGWRAWLVGIAGPLFFACAMYLAPLLFDPAVADGEYAMWAPIIVTIAAGAGLLANLVAAVMLWIARRIGGRAHTR